MEITPILRQFAPPANLNDLNEDLKARWSQEVIDPMFESGKAGYTHTEDGKPILNNAPRPQFFNPRTTEKAPDLTSKEIAWIGFPRMVKQKYPTDEARWKAADRDRNVQDEYCEWSLSRNEQEKITSVQFTCEGPEYWEFLGETSPEKVVELYQKYISPNVVKSDLFEDGRYNHKNKWNNSTSNGAMHLIQVNNSLGAEVELAAGSSMVREKEGKILEGNQELIQCGRYGQPERNSDPHIGAEVNTLTRAGAQVALKDPVGLYFGDFNPVGWETPDGSNPKDYWKILRGNEETPVRVAYEVPQDKGFTVGDIKIDGQEIMYAGQIADFVHIKLTGIAQNIGKTPVKTFGCVKIIKKDAEANLTLNNNNPITCYLKGRFYNN